VPGALTILRELDPIIPTVKEGIDTTRPILDVVGTYGCDIANAGAGIRSFTGFSQPGTGPNGPAQAFRLYAVQDGRAALGISDPTIRRRAYGPPCYTLNPKPYALFFPKVDLTP
jgi:hypothetical protein